MTPYRERVQAGEYEPKTEPAQPKDVHFTRDPATGRKVTPKNATKAKTKP